MSIYIEVAGEINIDPPLNQKEIEFLTKFSETRKCLYNSGQYDVSVNQELYKEPFINHPTTALEFHKFNTVPTGQPSFWCNWVPTSDGKKLVHNGQQKYSKDAEWVEYLIKNFLNEQPIAETLYPEQFGFLQGHKCNGKISITLEADQKEKINVKNNETTVSDSPSFFKILTHKFKKHWDGLKNTITEYKEHKEDRKKVKQQQKNIDEMDTFIRWLGSRASRDFYSSLIPNAQKDINDIRFNFSGSIGEYSNGKSVFVNLEKVTALMLAAEYSNRAAIECLIKAGADTTLTDNNGNTAYDLLKRKTHQGDDEFSYIQQLLNPEKNTLKSKKLV